MDHPTTVGGHEILAELGRGTTGVVYKARHPLIEPDRVVALKMLVLGSARTASASPARPPNTRHPI